MTTTQALPPPQVTPIAAITITVVMRQANIFGLKDLWADPALSAVYVAAALLACPMSREWAKLQASVDFNPSDRPFTTTSVASALQGRFRSIWAPYTVGGGVDLLPTTNDQTLNFVQPLRLLYPTLRVVNIASLWLQAHTQLQAGVVCPVTASVASGIVIPDDFVAACRRHVMRDCCWQPLPPQHIRRILQ